MALIRVRVSTAEHPDGSIDYPNATATEELTDGALFIMRGFDIIAEFPAGRFVSWESLDEPHTDEQDEG